MLRLGITFRKLTRSGEQGNSVPLLAATTQDSRLERPRDPETLVARWSCSSANFYGMDFVGAVERESRLFLETVQELDFESGVPTCPDWSVADLVWHLAEVQWFWGRIVGELRSDPEFPDLERPADGQLIPLYKKASSELVDVLAKHDPADKCWSWHAEGHTVGWVRRRQAHEALIHRADAELAGGLAPSLDRELAEDGIDEFIDVMQDGFPAWGSFEKKGQVVDIVAPGYAAALELGWFSGTSPEGKPYAEDAFCRAETGRGNVVLTGDASTLDLWMWRRAPMDAVRIDGDVSLAERLRAASDIQ